MADAPPTSLDALIDTLQHAHRRAGLIDATPWAAAVTTEADAYAVQAGVAQALGWPRDRWKSGGAGLQGPFSHSPVAPTPGRDLLGIEAEVALRLARDVTPEDAQGPLDASLIDGLCIAVECIASRWAQALDAPALLRMADFQSNAGLLTGPWQPWQALDWARLGWRLALPGQPVIERRGGHSLADPAGVLPAWLRHATRHGDTVKAGTVVTTGAWGGVHPCPGSPRGTLAIEGLGEFSFSATA
ncbi:MAG: 2-keto-4-pentenoate hydratase [Burkholderiales bacterium]|nr:MAG: 2-keto-4-pentenoate hydratase [Burkholderiales bacterium]